VIVKFARHNLSPVLYLVFQCIKTPFWTYVFAVDIEAAVNRADTGFSFLFSIPTFLSSLGQLIYGSVIMHRQRSGFFDRGHYDGVQGRGADWHAGGYDSPPRGSYAAHSGTAAPPNPFRDPSRNPSPEPGSRQRLSSYSGASPPDIHPAFRQPGKGEAEIYYNAPEAAHQSYEMQSTAYRSS
jgi:hypothetical protein